MTLEQLYTSFNGKNLYNIGTEEESVTHSVGLNQPGKIDDVG